MTTDTTRRYAPDRVIVSDPAGKVRSVPVTGYALIPPGHLRPGCPIRPDYHALECRTAYGSRWYGVGGGEIDSSLRMVVWGLNPLDEVTRQWEPA